VLIGAFFSFFGVLPESILRLAAALAWLKIWNRGLQNRRIKRCNSLFGLLPPPQKYLEHAFCRMGKKLGRRLVNACRE
jgi:hypothetical protein